MVINAFECPHCKRTTKQMSVSMQEEIAGDMPTTTSKTIFGTLGAIADYSGITKVVQSIYERTWKCCECGMLTHRDQSGKVKEYKYHGGNYWFDY